MAKKKIKELILFLKSFRHQLLALSNKWNTKVMTASKLNDIEAFKNAEDEERDVIRGMIRPDTKLDTGQDSFVSAADANQVSENTVGVSNGISKKYASGHFRSDKEAA